MNIDTLIQIVKRLRMKTPYRSNRNSDLPYMAAIELLNRLYDQYLLVLTVDQLAQWHLTLTQCEKINPVSERKKVIHQIVTAWTTQSLQSLNFNIVLHNVPGKYNEENIVDALQSVSILHICSVIEGQYLLWCADSYQARELAKRLERAFIDGHRLQSRYIRRTVYDPIM